MRVIDADDLAVGGAGLANGGEMVARIDQKTRGARVEIARSAAASIRAGGADQKPAALGGQGLAGMRHDRVERGLRDFYNASTTIAIPIPPPMHSDATP